MPYKQGFPPWTSIYIAVHRQPFFTPPFWDVMVSQSVPPDFGPFPWLSYPTPLKERPLGSIYNVPKVGAMKWKGRS
jgi:hypothetical protein